MKDIWTDNIVKKVNSKKVTIAIILAILIIAIVIFLCLYMFNKNARQWIDKSILRKEVKQDNVVTINIKENQNNIYAFNKYIGILNKGQFSIYNNTGSKETDLEIKVSNPIFDSANRFLVIAESKGQKVYMLADKNIQWENNVDGEITQIHVNKNGYVAVVVTNTSYKTVVVMYNPEGKEMSKTFLPATRTVDVSISNDNKHLAIAELDTSGSIIQSNIKIVSLENSNTESSNLIENAYQGESGKLITDIEYQDKDKLICMYTDSIHKIENGEDTVLVDNTNKKVILQAIKLNENVVSIQEKSSGLFTADSIVDILNIDNKNSKQYVVNSIVKDIYSYGDIIALNLGTEVEFINKDGWLVKRYIANQEITNIIVSNNIAGIIYRDKIEIVNL